MTRAEWTTIAAKVNLLWPNARWTAPTIRAGEDLVLDLEPEYVMGAVQSLATEGKEFPPSVGQLRKRSIELSEAANGLTPPDPDTALREVYDTIARFGSYRTPEFSHAAIYATVEAMGGWQAVCMDENPEAFRAHFMRLYGTCRARTERESLMPPAVRELLAGLNLRADRELSQ